jgi:hypothetical protein
LAAGVYLSEAPPLLGVYLFCLRGNSSQSWVEIPTSYFKPGLWLTIFRSLGTKNSNLKKFKIGLLHEKRDAEKGGLEDWNIFVGEGGFAYITVAAVSKQDF